MSSAKNPKKMMVVAFAYGIELIAVVVVGLFAGKWAGERLGYGEWGAVVGCFVGFMAWTYRMVRVQQTQNQPPEK